MTTSFEFSVIVVPLTLEFFVEDIKPLSIVAGEELKWSLPDIKDTITLESINVGIGIASTFISFDEKSLTFSISGSNSTDIGQYIISIELTDLYGSKGIYFLPVDIEAPLEIAAGEQDDVGILEVVEVHVGEDLSWQLEKPYTAEQIEVDLGSAANFTGFDQDSL